MVRVTIKEEDGVIIDDLDQSGWYRRHENNGWRLVSDRVSCC